MNVTFSNFLMLKKEIEQWADSKKNLPNEISDSYALFLRETQTKVSRSYFFEIFSQYTKVQVVKTGGVYTKNNDIVETIVKRSFYGVNMKNTYSIDEKPIIVNNYKSKKVRVTSNHRGKVPSNIVSAYNMMDKLSNLYLLCCISYEGIILYHLSENPIDTAKFNAFMHKLLYSIPKNDFGQFLLIDNATFHSLDEFIKQEMKKKKACCNSNPATRMLVQSN